MNMILLLSKTGASFTNISPINSTVEQYGTTNFSCRYNATANPLLIWFINNSLVPSLRNLPNNHRIEAYTNQVFLIITNVSAELNGVTYQCQIISQRQIQNSSIATLYVGKCIIIYNQLEHLQTSSIFRGVSLCAPDLMVLKT